MSERGPIKHSDIELTLHKYLKISLRSFLLSIKTHKNSTKVVNNCTVLLDSSGHDDSCLLLRVWLA